MSSSNSPRAANANGDGRARSLFSALGLHWAGVAVLALVNVYFLAQMAFLWQQASSRSADAISQQRIALKTAEIAAQPLRGLDAKLALATTQADTFYKDRLPASYSEMLTELGALTKKDGVRLVRVSYDPQAVLPGSEGELAEVQMDASLSGDYRPLVMFINSLERDKMFFVIKGVTLTGQKSGTVNLRLALSTYLRGGAALGPPTAEAAAAASGGPGQ
jgi:hypothetical protein